MSTPASTARPFPSSILLATDLSARGDRALSRALQLARQWKARLVVLTVLPQGNAAERVARRLPGATALDDAAARPLAEQRLRRLLEGETDGVDTALRIGHGHVGRAVLQAAAEENCALIVTGIAGDPLFELPLVGSTVLWLTRHSRLPVLIVHDRVRGPYRNLSLACDFSDSASQAARCALELFGPPLQLSVVHALQSSGGLLSMDDREVLLEQDRLGAREQAQAVVAGLRPVLGDAQVHKHIALGDPAPLLAEHARANDVELVVVATHGRSALFDLLIGSVARRLVETLETDTLLVRDPRSLAAANADAAASA